MTLSQQRPLVVDLMPRDGGMPFIMPAFRALGRRQPVLFRYDHNRELPDVIQDQYGVVLRLLCDIHSDLHIELVENGALFTRPEEEA